jgi:VanZ family protein
VIRALIAWGPTAAWATVLFLLSEIGVFRTNVWLALNDKLVHFVLYAVLGAALAWGKRKSGTAWSHWILIGLGMVYGLVDELHQRYTPGRIPSVADFVADVAGVVSGYVLVVTAWHLATRRQPGPSSANTHA